jgi:membrane associated rhomboid family serine protease
MMDGAFWIVLQTGERQWMEVLPEDFRSGMALLVYLLILMWVLSIMDALFFRQVFAHLSIRPRKLAGLPGIAVAPLLHGNFKHLAANSGPFAILGTIILLQGLEVLSIVTIGSWLVSGVGIWLLGRADTRHLGASGVVFGYLGYILFRGYFERSFPAMAASVFVGLLYSSALWGLLPLQRGKSWVGHSMGFLAGFFMARYLDIIQEWVMYNSGF